MYEQGLRNDRDPVHPVEINTTTFSDYDVPM